MRQAYICASSRFMAAPTGSTAMTGSRVRAFVAVNLPDAVKAEMGKLIAAIDALEVRARTNCPCRGSAPDAQIPRRRGQRRCSKHQIRDEYRRRQIRTVRSDAGGGRSVPKRCRTTHPVGGSGRQTGQALDASERASKCAGDGGLRPEQRTVQPSHDDRAGPQPPIIQPAQARDRGSGRGRPLTASDPRGLDSPHAKHTPARRSDLYSLARRTTRRLRDNRILIEGVLFWRSRRVSRLRVRSHRYDAHGGAPVLRNEPCESAVEGGELSATPYCGSQ